MASLNFSIYKAAYSIVARDDSKSRQAFVAEMEKLASFISSNFNKALLLRWDGRVGYRSASLYINGEAIKFFTEADEIWVLLDDEGNPLLNGEKFRVSELDPNPETEYATIVNAFQLGISEFGIVNWEELFDQIVS
jgi:hypothetical protein